MPNAAEHLRSIRTFAKLVRYLEEELEWPLLEYEFEDLAFEYSPAELGLRDEEAAKVKTIHQLRPLRHDQPWGIFFVEFECKRIPVVVLRRILSHLVIKKRASANKAERAAWNIGDLLFISAFGDDAADREIAFAHFGKEGNDLPTLRVLGWDGLDTLLKLDHIAATLKAELRWPENPSDHITWREQWSLAFRHRLGHVIRTADALAQRLAALARGIRDSARTLMRSESEHGPLRQLHKAFQTVLIHNLTEEDFADTYAQTITYGLLTAAISRTDMSSGRYGTALLTEDIARIVPVTNPFLKEMLATFLKLGGRKGGIDFDELGVQDVVELLRGDETDLPAILRDFGNRTRGQDPVIHFYEHFLTAYDKKLKIQRGVFYTPQPVVSYIVRSVHELLQTQFGLEDGLASTVTWGEMIKRQPALNLPLLTDESGETRTISAEEPIVQILDPATGTATFLVECIDVIYQTLTAKWTKCGLNDDERRSAWNEYVPRHLLPRLYGYELLMAPYAIAHMKVPLKLQETGFTAWDRLGDNDRVNIYLTNALEPKVKQLPQIGFDALAHEASAVNEVKWYKRFTVIVGNPPYSTSISEPIWIMRLLDDWKRGLNETKSDLNREEWKFLRFAQNRCQQTKFGIVGFILNRDFLDGIAKRQLRKDLAATFPLRIVVDLNGDVKGNISDENVFEIEQGVTIAILCSNHSTSALRFTSLMGRQQLKCSALAAKSPIDRELREVNVTAPYFRWVPFADKRAQSLDTEYGSWFPINEVFSSRSSGIQTKNDPICIGYSEDEVFKRVQQLALLTPDEVREKLGINPQGVWSLVAAQDDLRTFGVSRQNVRRILYRPFDWRFIYYTHKSGGFLGRPRFEVMRHMLSGFNLGLVFNRQIVGQSVSHFGVSRDLICHGTFYLGNKGQDYLAPLYLHEPEVLSRSTEEWKSNLTPAFLSAVYAKLGASAGDLIHEDIFHYLYAVLYSPSYRSRYAEFLKIDFPRLPLTSCVDLFRALGAIGRELVSLHLLESRKLDEPAIRYAGRADPKVERVSYSCENETAWLDKSQTCGFRGVPESVWNFHVGGYQVCEKWLKDRRGRTLSTEDINHYERVVVALKETIRLMSEIDEVIERHGGWPLVGSQDEPKSSESEPLPFA